MAGWLLRYVDEDTYDVIRNGRQLRRDVSLDTAKRHLRRYRKPTEKMIVEEKDGYQVPLSSLR